jgi:hypothetical protein
VNVNFPAAHPFYKRDDFWGVWVASSELFEKEAENQ